MKQNVYIYHYGDDDKYADSDLYEDADVLIKSLYKVYYTDFTDSGYYSDYLPMGFIYYLADKISEDDCITKDDFIELANTKRHPEMSDNDYYNQYYHPNYNPNDEVQFIENIAQLQYWIGDLIVKNIRQEYMMKLFKLLDKTNKLLDHPYAYLQLVSASSRYYNLKNKLFKIIKRECDVKTRNKIVNKIHKSVMSNSKWFHSFWYAHFLFKLDEKDKFKEYCNVIDTDECEYFLFENHRDKWKYSTFNLREYLERFDHIDGDYLRCLERFNVSHNTTEKNWYFRFNDDRF